MLASLKNSNPSRESTTEFVKPKEMHRSKSSSVYDKRRTLSHAQENITVNNLDESLKSQKRSTVQSPLPLKVVLKKGAHSSRVSMIKRFSTEDESSLMKQNKDLLNFKGDKKKRRGTVFLSKDKVHGLKGDHAAGESPTRINK